MIPYEDMVVYFTVPRTREAMDAWVPGITDYARYEHFEVTNGANNLLQQLYNMFNKEFNIIIDNCEDEKLSFMDLPKALSMVETFNNSDSTELSIVLDKLRSAIKLAMFYGTCLYFDF